MNRDAKRNGGDIRRLRPHALCSLLAVLTSGCLGHLYEVPRAELERLVRTHPQERGHDIYAVQQFSVAEEPEPAPALVYADGMPPPDYTMSVTGHWLPPIYLEFGPPSYSSPVHAASSVTNSTVHDASPVTEAPASQPLPTGSPSADSLKHADKLLVVAIVIGVAAGIGLAASEGVRYEGWVAVHPRHPVHLRTHGGGQTIVALDELTEAHLRNVDRATLSGYEGAGLWLRGAAPLNRVGYSYQFGAGNDSLALPGLVNQHGPGFRFALGYYPAKSFGLLVETRLLRGNEGGDVFRNARLGLEAQWYPLALGRLHLGAFAGGGQAWFASSGVNLPATRGERPYVSFGALGEIELATRLGLTFRWGQDWLPTAPLETRGLINSWSVGLAVY
jgi:hypothetical protein